MTHIERLLALVSEYLLYVIQKEIDAAEKSLVQYPIRFVDEAGIRERLRQLKEEQFEIKLLVSELKEHLR